MAVEHIDTKALDTGAAHGQGNTATFYSFVEFVNKLNATNPAFRQYEIPGAK